MYTVLIWSFPAMSRECWDGSEAASWKSLKALWNVWRVFVVLNAGHCGWSLLAWKQFRTSRPSIPAGNLEFFMILSFFVLVFYGLAEIDSLSFTMCHDTLTVSSPLSICLPLPLSERAEDSVQLCGFLKEEGCFIDRCTGEVKYSV